MSVLIQSKKEYDRLIHELRTVARHEATLAIDTETTGLRVYQNDRPTGISCAYWWPIGQRETMHSWYLPVGHVESKNLSPRRLLQAFNRHPGIQCYHHAEFDWRVLTLCGDFKVPDSEHLYDTLVVEFLIDENADKRLKWVASRYFGEDAKAEMEAMKKIKRGRTQADVYKELRQTEKWGKPHPAAPARAEAARIAAASKKTFATLTATDMAEYGARDAELTLMTCHHQGTKTFVLDEERFAAMQREYDVLHVLYRMMGTGIHVNKQACVAQANVAQVRLDELTALFADINMNSVTQLIKMIYVDWGVPVQHRTATGQPSTNKEALEELNDDPRVADLLEYRHLNKAMVGYYRPLHETIAEDGRIHPSFSSTRTVTARLSCSDPNLQTIPRADTLEGVRDLFEPAPGYELWEFDLAQAELRIMAGFCEDENLIGALSRGEDLHALTALRVFGPDFTPLQRRVGKNLNYGFPYGVGPRKAAKYRVTSDTPMTECAAWKWNRASGVKRPKQCYKCLVCTAADDLEGYRNAYPKLVRLMKGLERIARRDGVLPMIVDGRYRHFRTPGRIVKFYTALNAVVQGAVAECMKSYMVRGEPGWISLGARLCLQVHDSLVMEVLPGTGEKVGALLQSVADELDYFEHLPMRFDCKNWTDHD